MGSSKAEQWLAGVDIFKVVVVHCHAHLTSLRPAFCLVVGTAAKTGFPVVVEVAVGNGNKAACFGNIEKPVVEVFSPFLFWCGVFAFQIYREFVVAEIYVRAVYFFWSKA